MTNESGKQHELEDLVVGHFDGDLSVDQEMKLAEALASCAEMQQFFRSYMRTEGRLHSCGRDGFLREPTALPAITAERSESYSSGFAIGGPSEGRGVRLVAASTSMAVCVAVILMLSF